MDPALEDAPCDLCGSTEVDVLRAAVPEQHAPRDSERAFSASSSAPLAHRLVRCRVCRLVYVSPRLPARGILEAYGEGEDHVFVGQSQARERTFETALERMESLTGGAGRVFDVGTANGSFLAVARRRGWSVDGCDPNPWLAHWAARHYDLAIRTGTLETLDLPEEPYDAVTFWDVIEHVPSPSAEITRAATLLKPGGALFLTYPDVSSATARLLGRHWPLFRAMHLFYFSKATMSRMLREAGFVIVAMQAHRPALEVGYLVERTGDLVGLPGRGLARLVRRAGIGRRHVPLHLGQTFVAARRIAR